MSLTEQKPVGHQMARGAAWMVLMRLVMRGAGIINMVIMARLLVPEDFGLIAMASIFIGAVETFSEFSFDVALIRDQKTRRAHYDTAWTLSIMRGTAAAMILIAVAELSASLFDEPRLEMIIIVLALATFLAGFQNIGIVDFRKTLDFRKDFVFMASEKIVAVAASVGLALALRNYWALVGGIVISKLWRVSASYLMHPFRPKLCLTEWRGLFAYTKWLLVQNIFTFCRNRADRIVIGKVLGAGSLGLYTIAFDLANLVTTELMAPIRRALLPGFARLAGERNQVKAMFLEVFGLTMWLGAPIAIGMALLALPLVTVALGETWLPAVPLIQMLAIAGFVALLSSSSHPVYLAINRPELTAYLNGLQVALLVPGLLIGTFKFGLLGACVAVVIAQLVTAFADIVVMLRLLKLSLRELIILAWRSLTALAAMSMAVNMLIRTWPRDASWLAEVSVLVIAVALGSLIYIGTSLLLWKLFAEGQGPERHVVRQLRQRLPRLRREGMA